MNNTLILDIKSVDDSGTLKGYAAVYNNVDLIGELIEKGAFSKWLKKKRKSLPLLWNHNASEVIGSIKTVTDDNNGLWVEGKINLEVAKANEVYSLLKNGDVTGMSIGFLVKKSERNKDGVTVLKELDLFEASITPIPANPAAQVVSVKALQETEEEHMDKAALDAINNRLTLIEYQLSGLKSLILETKSVTVSTSINTNETEHLQSFESLMSEIKNSEIFRKA